MRKTLPEDQGSEHATLILKALHERGPLTAQQLLQTTGMNVTDLSSALLGLNNRKRIRFDDRYPQHGAWKLEGNPTHRG